MHTVAHLPSASTDIGKKRSQGYVGARCLFKLCNNTVRVHSRKIMNAGCQHPSSSGRHAHAVSEELCTSWTKEGHTLGRDSHRGDRVSKGLDGLDGVKGARAHVPHAHRLVVSPTHQCLLARTQAHLHTSDTNFFTTSP